MTYLLVGGVVAGSLFTYILVGTLFYTYLDVEHFGDDQCAPMAVFWPLTLPILIMLMTIAGASVRFRAYLKKKDKAE